MWARCCSYLWARETRSSPLKVKILRGKKKQLYNSLQNGPCMFFLVKVIKETVSWESTEESWPDPWTVVVSSKTSARTEPKAWAAQITKNVLGILSHSPRSHRVLSWKNGCRWWLWGLQFSQLEWKWKDWPVGGLNVPHGSGGVQLS